MAGCQEGDEDDGDGIAGGNMGDLIWRGVLGSPVLGEQKPRTPGARLEKEMGKEGERLKGKELSVCVRLAAVGKKKIKGEGRPASVNRERERLAAAPALSRFFFYNGKGGAPLHQKKKVKG